MNFFSQLQVDYIYSPQHPDLARCTMDTDVGLEATEKDNEYYHKNVDDLYRASVL